MTHWERRNWFVGGMVAILSSIGCTEEPTAVPPRELKIAAEDGVTKDSFGASVAISGDTVIVGAVLDDDLGEDSGSAYIFVRNDDGTWTQQAKLLAPDGKAGDFFGNAVALSNDTAVVGAPYAQDKGIATGVAHVYTRNGSTWTHQTTLVPNGSVVDDQIGYAVAIDGDSILIGAPGDDEVAMDAGAAYTFQRSGTSWMAQNKLVPTPGGAAGYFGVSVALSNSTALVGAWDDGSAKNAGIAFAYTSNGSGWALESTLLPTDPGTEDTFGYSVALSGDTALIGASGDDDAGKNSGSAYVFTRNGTSWAQDQKLAPSDAAADDVFGSSVAVWNDFAVVGAYWDDDRGQYSGATYTFALTNGRWTQQDKHAPSDGIAGQKFGCAVAIDGDLAIAGAYGDDEKGIESGAAYVFSVTGTTP